MEQINFVYSNPAKEREVSPPSPQPKNRKENAALRLKQEGEPAIQCGPPALATLAMVPVAAQATCALCFICSPYLRD